MGVDLLPLLNLRKRSGIVVLERSEVHFPTRNLTRRFVALELFPRESFLSQQQDFKRTGLFFLETFNRRVPTRKEE